MVCVVMSDMTGISSTVDDADILAQLKTLRAITGRRWEIKRGEIVSKRWFRKAVKTNYYCLYLGCPTGEWHMVGFPPDGSSICSTGQFAQRITLLAYIKGVIDASGEKS
jgi:hypothetical protein